MTSRLNFFKVLEVMYDHFRNYRLIIFEILNDKYELSLRLC